VNDPLNIVLYVNNFLPAIGGREMVVFQLARALTDIGHQVRVLGPSGFFTHRKVKFAFPVHRWPKLFGLFPEQIAGMSLSADLRLWGADVVHAHNTYPTGYVASRTAATRTVPLIITPHGADIQTIPKLSYGHRLNPVIREKIDAAVVAADRVTAISENVAAALTEAGAVREKICMIPNGVDTRRFPAADGAAVRAEFGLGEQTRLILTVGNYEPRRGHENLIKSMPSILEKHSAARLVIVGRNTEGLGGLIEKLGLQRKVVLTGSIQPMANDRDRLGELYGASDVYVSAGVSGDAEGLSLAMLDGMAAGLTVVATDISGNRDLIEHDVSGILVKPGEPSALSAEISKVLATPDLSARLRQRSSELVAGFDWRAIAERYVDVYREVLRERS